MMKSISFLLIMAFLCSCAQKVIVSKVQDQKEDALQGESFLRYNAEILSQFKGDVHPGLIKCHQGKISQGLEELKESYQDQKKSQDYWVAVGNCYFLNENFKKAQFYYQFATQTAKRIGKESASAWNNLGLVALRLRHFNEAQEYFEKANKLAPSLSTPKYNLAHLYLQFGLVDKAKGPLGELYQKAPQDSDILFSLGVLTLLQSQPQRALTIFDKIPAQQRRRADMATYYALALYQVGKFKQAQEILSNKESSKLGSIDQMAQHLENLVEKAIEEQEQKAQQEVKG